MKRGENTDADPGTQRRPAKGGWGWAAFLLGPFPSSWYPELRLCRSPFERTEAAARAKQRGPRDLRAVLMIVLICAGALLPILAIRAPRPPWLPEWALILGALSASVALALLGAFLAREAGRRVIREYLLSRGLPVCLHCGYDLRGLPPGDRAPPCPECGRPVCENAARLIAATADS